GYLRDGQFLEDSKLQVIATPGHTPGGLCFYHEEGQLLLTGDTLFAGSVGRTDLGGGDMQELITSCRRLLTYDDATQVLPGHGPASTIAQERSNPFLQ
ncbi:MAG TPA: MBL fold metallo-hydrolase, partial [Sphaerochaeta sp.]|nr:MBL fold metallo-hydrolase [Sphaerochaeta sp.]